MAATAKRALQNVSTRTIMLAIVAVILGGQPGLADISQTVFSIQASNESGTATFETDFDSGVWDPAAQTYAWSLDSPVELLDGTEVVATLESAALAVEFLPSPQITLEFGVEAGTTDTECLVDSALVGFNTLPADLSAGRFTAGCTVWDSGANDGMWFYQPDLDGTGAFKALYNNDGQPEPALFSHLLALVGGSGGGSASGSQSYPNSGTLPIGEDIWDMSIQANFILTSNDSAEASSTFLLVPEPAGLTTLALVGAILAAKHRRRG